MQPAKPQAILIISVGEKAMFACDLQRQRFGALMPKRIPILSL